MDRQYVLSMFCVIEITQYVAPVQDEYVGFTRNHKENFSQFNIYSSAEFETETLYEEFDA